MSKFSTVAEVQATLPGMIAPRDPGETLFIQNAEGEIVAELAVKAIRDKWVPIDFNRPPTPGF